MAPRFEKIVCTTMPPSEMKQRLSQLEEVLLRHVPQSLQLLNICRIGLKEWYPETTLVQFYRYVESDKNWPDEDEEETRPFIICIQQPTIFTTKAVVIMTPGVVTPSMISTFDSFIGWNSPQIFVAVPQSFWPEVLKMCKHHGMIHPYPEGLHCNFLAISDLEKAKNINIAEREKHLADCNMKIRILEENDVPQVLSTWYNHVQPEKNIRDNMKTLFSCGIFTEEGELATSVMFTALGSCNRLFTPEKFKRKGYGQTLMSWLSKTVAKELDTPPSSEVEIRNFASRKLMENIGYETLFETMWIFYNPLAAASP